MELAIVWLVLMVAAFYLLLWRPQQRRVGAARALQAALHDGDRVMTTSGIYGRITRLGEAEVELEIAPNVVIRVARGAIGERFAPEGHPAGGGHDEGTGAG